GTSAPARYSKAGEGCVNTGACCQHRIAADAECADRRRSRHRASAALPGHCRSGGKHRRCLGLVGSGVRGRSDRTQTRDGANPGTNRLSGEVEMSVTGLQLLREAGDRLGKITAACVRVDAYFGVVPVADLEGWLERMVFFDDPLDPDWTGHVVPK